MAAAKRTAPAKPVVEPAGSAVDQLDEQLGDQAAAVDDAVPAPDEPTDAARSADCRPFVSEGMRQDIELYGSAVDPISGRRVTADDLR